ncbi:MAG: ferrous iron transport protein A [Phycisphaerales bacterium]|nr:ferrous iron transport protein A [Phycisphaerales bacterium]
MDKKCEVPNCPGPDLIGNCALSQLGIGCGGTVCHVETADLDLRRRLLEMGFCNGAKVEVVRRAPLGDPIEFRLRGYCLSLRHEQARFVRINAPVQDTRSPSI